MVEQILVFKGPKGEDITCHRSSPLVTGISRQVVVIDSDPDMRFLAEVHLMGDGHQVKSCSGCPDGHACLDGCKISEGVSLVVIGCVKLDGDVARMVERIRAGAPRVPVWVLSENLPGIKKEVLERFRQMGAKLALRSFPLLRELANNPGMSANGQVYLEEREEFSQTPIRSMSFVPPGQVEQAITAFTHHSSR